MEHPYSSQKTCPRCLKPFECGLSNGTCWCFAHPPLMPVAENADCLCPRCLEEAIAIKQKQTDSQPPAHSEDQ